MSATSGQGWSSGLCKLPGGRDWPAFWWVALDLVPLMFRAKSGGMLWDVCGLSMTLGSLSADEWIFVPVLLVVWHGAFNTGACKHLGGAWSWS